MDRTIWIVLTSGIFFFLSACGERPKSYESQFKDSVSINFPPGHAYADVEPLRVQVDQLLRERKIGYWSGVLGIGGDIDHVSLDLDFELIDEEELVQALIDDGILPKDVEVEYHSEKANNAE